MLSLSIEFTRPLRLLCLVAVLLLLPLSAASAMPVLPDPVTVMQPDGTLLTLQPFGDEWNSGYEYQSYTVILNATTGYWVYAETSSGDKLSPSEQRAGIDKPAAALSPHLRDRLLPQPEGLSPNIGGDVWQRAG